MKELFHPLINAWDWCHDFLYDWRKGINARGIVPLAMLPLSAFEQEHGRRYQGSRRRVFKRLMKHFAPYLPQGTFLDVGCGKGRVMVLANDYGHKKIWGLDLSADLLRICQNNLQRFQQKTAARPSFQLFHSDICDFSAWAEVDIVYLFNPFDGVIFKKVMQSWERQLRPGQKLFIIYVNPIRSFLLDLHPKASLLAHLPAWNSNNEAKLYLFSGALPDSSD